jgi:chromosome segregation ATPase
MSEQSASSTPTPDELTALRELVALTKSQISSINDLVVAGLDKMSEKRSQLEAELATRRQSLVEWMRSRDVLSKTLQGLTLRARSDPHMAHVHNLRLTNPTATPSDAELAQKLVEEENRDLDAIRAAIDTRESYISVLRSRVAVLEENIAACSATSSHIESMIALQVPHKNRLQALLGQYKSRLHPLLQLPEGTLRDIFLQVVQLSREEWKRRISIDIGFLAWKWPSTYPSDPALALTAVCHRWRNLGTHQDSSRNTNT